jgi:hypothetical protein
MVNSAPKASLAHFLISTLLFLVTAAAVTLFQRFSPRLWYLEDTRSFSPRSVIG